MSDETSVKPEPSSKTSAPLFSNLPVEVTVSVGRATPTIDELLELRADSVLRLDKSVEDPVDIMVGDRLIARGILEESSENGTSQLVVRLTSVPGRPGE